MPAPRDTAADAPIPLPADIACTSATTASREQRRRLLQLWRSAGWPAHDLVEAELRVAGWVRVERDAQGRETLQLTDAGLEQLVRARAAGRRALSAHDRLAGRVARELLSQGRLVWPELPLRGHTGEAWRLSRPDLFSIRHTTVAGYLHPMVHEIKVSRADLLSDLRQPDKGGSYRWLCSECHYVFPAGLAEADEIPEPFGVWVLHGAAGRSAQDDTGSRLECLRPARFEPRELPLAVWLALARATPLTPEGLEDIDPWAPTQHELGAP